MDNVVVCLVAGMGWILVMTMLYSTVKRLYASLWARRIMFDREGNLRVVAWDDVTGMTVVLRLNTTLSMLNEAAVVRAVRMWGVVRHKSIIEIAESDRGEKVLFKTY